MVSQCVHAPEPALPEEGDRSEADATSNGVHQALPVRPRPQSYQVSTCSCIVHVHVFIYTLYVRTYGHLCLYITHCILFSAPANVHGELRVVYYNIKLYNVHVYMYVHVNK